MTTRKPSGVMLCYPFNCSKAKKFKSIIIQPKLDGVRCRALFTSTDVLLLSSTNKEIHLPYLKKELKHVIPPNKNVDGLFFDGELYIYGADSEEINSIISSSFDQLVCKVDYHIFDIVATHDIPLLSTLAQLKDRMKLLDSVNFNIFRYLFKVSSVYIDNQDDICKAIDIYAKIYQDKGHEGAIVKNANSIYKPKRSKNWLKYKPLNTNIYKILRAVEEKNKYGFPKNRLGAFEVIDEGHRVFNVESGFNFEQREEFWKDLKSVVGKYVKVRYFATNDYGTPKHPIFVEIT